MALLTTYGDYNKVTKTALNIKYSVERASYTSTGLSGQSITVPYYRVTRYATKQYEYVGMEYDTAISCQNAKINQYTRDYSRITTDGWLTAEAFTGCTSEIVATHQEGHMWNVAINVNETDEKPSTTLPTHPASLFTSENYRDYDDTWVPGGGQGSSSAVAT